MSKRIIKTKSKSGTANPIPPPQPKGTMAEATGEQGVIKEPSEDSGANTASGFAE